MHAIVLYDMCSKTKTVYTSMKSPGRYRRCDKLCAAKFSKFMWPPCVYSFANIRPVQQYGDTVLGNGFGWVIPYDRSISCLVKINSTVMLVADIEHPFFADDGTFAFGRPGWMFAPR